MIYEELNYLLVALVIFVISICAIAYKRSKNPLHPSILIGGLCAFPYILQPAYLNLFDPANLYWYLSHEQIWYSQIVNSLGVASLMLGLLVFSCRVRADQTGEAVSKKRDIANAPTTFTNWKLAYRVGAAGGLVALVGFSLTIANAGGLLSAYGEGYGGGVTQYGYLRDLDQLSLPAAMLVLLSRRGQPLRARDILLLLLILSPSLIHGFIGGRRGPTFSVLAGVGLAYLISRDRIPSLSFVLVGGFSVGVLLLLILANRDTISLRTGVVLDRNWSESYAFEANVGNEFVVGAGLIVEATERGEFNWGKRHLITLFVRPIPRQMWPNKYIDTAVFLGIPNIEDSNAGTVDPRFIVTMGWEPAKGAAPGMIADLWIDFYFFSFVLLFLFGMGLSYLATFTFSSSLLGNAFFCVLISLALYLIMQAVGAFLYRALWYSAIPTIAWAIMRNKTTNGASIARRRSFFSRGFPSASRQRPYSPLRRVSL